MSKKQITQNVVLMLIVALIVIACLIFAKGAAFEGTDTAAQNAVSQTDPNYKPWAKPLFVPPSTEIESMLFALQAAIGSGVVCFCLGYLKGKANRHDLH